MATLKNSGGGLFGRSETETAAFNTAKRDTIAPIETKVAELEKLNPRAMSDVQKTELNFYKNAIAEIRNLKGGKSRKSKTRRSGKKSRKSVRRR